MNDEDTRMMEALMREMARNCSEGKKSLEDFFPLMESVLSGKPFAPTQSKEPGDVVFEERLKEIIGACGPMLIGQLNQVIETVKKEGAALQSGGRAGKPKA